MKKPDRRSESPRSTLFARLDAWLEQRQLQATEAWLATSENVAELEARMRDLTRAATYPFH